MEIGLNTTQCATMQTLNNQREADAKMGVQNIAVLYIGSRCIGEFASIAGLRARIGLSVFGYYQVIPLTRVDEETRDAINDEFLPF